MSEKTEEYFFEKNLDYTNNYEKCVKEIEENIVKVVKDNPGITTYEVLQREMNRARSFSNKVHDSVRKAFTEALANNLGEEIKLAGKSKKIEGKYYQQLTIF
jgi:hypothetical protein